MSRERLDFRRRPPGRARSGRPLGAMVLLLVLVAAVLLLRPLWEPRLPAGVLVEVVGEVPRPGLHLIRTPTLAEAVRAAGGQASGLPDQALHEGDRVVVSPDGVHVSPSGDPLLVALPIDVNTADPDALQAIPGIGPALATRIVEDRAALGPFASTADLSRVAGIGPDTLAQITPFLDLPEPPLPVPVDPNLATAAELETLPGIGPVLAARIVVDRADGGPYHTVDELQRVPGIGPDTVERLRPLVALSPPP